MSIVKLLFTLIGSLFLCVSCTDQKRSIYPEEIRGAILSVNTTKLGIPGNHEILRKNVLYNLHRDGSYVCLLNDDLYELGEYSYSLDSKKKQGRLKINYTVNNQNYNYTLLMNYETPESGDWIAEESNDPILTPKERGTFKFMK